MTSTGIWASSVAAATRRSGVCSVDRYSMAIFRLLVSAVPVVERRSREFSHARALRKPCTCARVGDPLASTPVNDLRHGLQGTFAKGHELDRRQLGIIANARPS